MERPEGFVACRDPNRHARPARLEIHGGVAVFHGYQEFEATRSAVRVLAEDPILERKRRLLAPFFCPRYLSGRVVLDLGANGGFFCFWALQSGAAEAIALEMDDQYVAMLEQARSHLQIGDLEVVKGSVGEWGTSADVVLALALVHWIYSSTEAFGSVDAVIERLAAMTGYMLVVEWIDPRDTAIEFFRHLDWNPHAARGPYTLEVFEASLARHFERFELVGEASETRRLYVAFRTSHEIDLSGPLPLLWPKERVIARRLLATHDGVEYWSCVYDGGDRIYKQGTLDLARREAELSALLDCEHFPHALEAMSGADYSLVTLERVEGVPLRREVEALRRDRARLFAFIRECLQILRELKAAGIVHRDIRPGNLLVRDGKPVLIDFGWATTENRPSATPVGLGESQRPPDGSFCDIYSTGKVLEELNGQAHPEFDPVIRLMTATDAGLRITDPDVLEVLAVIAFERGGGSVGRPGTTGVPEGQLLEGEAPGAQVRALRVLLEQVNRRDERLRWLRRQQETLMERLAAAEAVVAALRESFDAGQREVKEEVARLRESLRQREGALEETKREYQELQRLAAERQAALEGQLRHAREEATESEKELRQELARRGEHIRHLEDRLTAGLGQLGRELSRARVTIATLLSSRSWRVTAPLRWLYTTISGPPPSIYLVVEQPDLGARPRVRGSVTLAGWVAGKASIKHVEVLCDEERIGEAQVGSPRPDVAAAHPELPEALRSGFAFVWDTSNIRRGPHGLTVRALDAKGRMSEATGTVVVDPTLYPVPEQPDPGGTTTGPTARPRAVADAESAHRLLHTAHERSRKPRFVNEMRSLLVTGLGRAMGAGARALRGFRRAEDAGDVTTPVPADADVGGGRVSRQATAFASGERADSAASRILFISHDAWRTGAPMVLLRLLRWLRANTDIPFEILLKDGNGELRREFEDLAPVSVWNKGGREFLRRRQIGLIYSNTITNGDVLGELDPGCPVICHVHELDYWIRYRVSPQHLRQLQKRTHHYVAVSQAVKRNLVENLGISPGEIDVIHGFIPVDEVSVDEAEACRVRAQLSLPPGALVVGACGTTDWRKAPDLFIQLARAVRRRHTDLGNPVHFVWVGGESEGPNFGALWHDVALAGLADRVHFVGTQTDPLPYFATFDVFALVSREDPFPLVMLEAASLGKPIVGFDSAGGAKEFVDDDAGFVVPYLDIEAMAARVLELLRSDELRHRLGSQARDRVRQHHDVAVAAPRIATLIRRFGQSSGCRRG